MKVSSIAPAVRLGIQNLHRKAPPIGAKALEAFARAHPGIDPQKMITTIDKLFGGRHTYTVIGSTSLHLQALRFLKPGQNLPLPNDFDVAVNCEGMNHFNNVSAREIELQGLSKDPCGIVFMPRDKGDALKIDVTSDREFGFAKYTVAANQIEGMKVAQINHTYDEELLRLIEPEYVELCGGIDNAKAMFNERWQHFDQTQLRMHSMTLSPDIQKILNLPFKPASDAVVIHHERQGFHGKQ